jgi:hypothetical protein
VGLGHVEGVVEGKVDSGCGGGNLREREHLEDLGLDGSKLYYKNCEIVYRIHLAQNKEKWRAFANREMSRTLRCFGSLHSK